MRHPDIEDVSVVGIPDETWGEQIAAAVVMKAGKSIALHEIREWAKAELASYKLPSLLNLTDQLPRNLMGKTLKSEVKKLFGG